MVLITKRIAVHHIANPGGFNQDIRMNSATRYQALIQLNHELQPRVVVEVGTNRGLRGSQFTFEHYIGFDLWEEGSQEIDTLERNGKLRCSMADAAALLERKAPPPRRVELIKGNTRDTLPAFAARGLLVDFAFIDGGHSIDTIRSDWESLRRTMSPRGTIVFDDYYEPELPGFGCNQIVRDLPFSFLGPPDFTEPTIRLVRVEMAKILE